jgi:hypothetical protein
MYHNGSAASITVNGGRLGEEGHSSSDELSVAGNRGPRTALPVPAAPRRPVQTLQPLPPASPAIPSQAGKTTGNPDGGRTKSVDSQSDEDDDQIPFRYANKVSVIQVLAHLAKPKSELVKKAEAINKYSFEKTGPVRYELIS